MRILKFNINGQRIDTDPECDFSGLVSGTKGYLKAMFTFSNEWHNCAIKAVFCSEEDEYPVPITIVKSLCTIPEEVLVGTSFTVYLVGEKNDYRICTNRIRVRQRRR